MEIISNNEDIDLRHRRERRELQAKIQALKKSVPKNDKKKRKEVMEEVSRLEKDLEDRQTSEKLAALQLQNNNIEDQTIDETSTEITENCKSDTPQRISKAQKRRDKKEQQARKLEEEVKASAKESETAPKAIETCKLINKLKDRDLCLVSIASDGDCLYNAVRHQIELHGLGNHTVADLRHETGNYINANKSLLLPYMTSQTTGQLLTDEEFEEYCHAVRTTPVWGGQVELKALSSILKVPIEVIQAEGISTIQGAEEFAGPNLIITYHRHLYSLGEHYNSTMPATSEQQE